MELKGAELRHIVWEQLDIRVNPNTTAEQMHALLQYETQAIADNPINDMRNQLMSFINDNKNRLSLPCDGNCFNHADGVVLYCHTKLMEGTNG